MTLIYQYREKNQTAVLYDRSLNKPCIICRSNGRLHSFILTSFAVFNSCAVISEDCWQLVFRAARNSKCPWASVSNSTCSLSESQQDGHQHTCNSPSADGLGAHLWSWVSFNNTLKHKCVSFFDGVDSLADVIILDVTRCAWVHDLGIGRSCESTHGNTHMQRRGCSHADIHTHEHTNTKGEKTHHVFSNTSAAERRPFSCGCMCNTSASPNDSGN